MNILFDKNVDETAINNTKQNAEFLKQQKDRRDNVEFQLNNGKDEVDTLLAIPNVVNVKYNTSNKLVVEFFEQGIATITVKKRGTRYDVYLDGTRLYKKLTAEKLLWEYDGLFVSLKDSSIKVVNIPADITAEVFIKNNKDTTTIIRY